jgi:hypothetical protein
MQLVSCHYWCTTTQCSHWCEDVTGPQVSLAVSAEPRIGVFHAEVRFYYSLSGKTLTLNCNVQHLNDTSDPTTLGPKPLRFEHSITDWQHAASALIFQISNS